ncbi:MAG: hypothetical protein MJ065_00430 [Oscillospiraceae bacterium]|nr:hypothetical protein [Oscillospiraceae bacterium]
MDLSKLMGMFGVDPAAAEELMQDGQMQEMMQDPELQQAMERPETEQFLGKLSGIFTQGGIMPGDLENLFEGLGGGADAGSPEQLDGLFAGVEQLFGGLGFDEIDLDEEAEAYQPEAEDASDRAFLTELKAWIKDTAADIPDKDVCMLEIGSHLNFDADGTPTVDLWLGYNTAQTDGENRANKAERWNIANWTENHFRSLDAEPLEDWCGSQGFDPLDEDFDENEMKQRIYDLAAAAVMELHRERFTEQIFGQKIPFLIEDYEYNQKTAIRAVKANGGKELLDAEFFSDCGFSEDGVS